MKKPSKEACEWAANLVEFNITGGMSSRMVDERHELAAYLRSLHEPVTEETLERWGWEKHENPSGTHYWTKPVDKPCSTCGTVGGGGRVQCPEYDKCGGDPGPCGCEMHDHGGNDVDCTIPCPDCQREPTASAPDDDGGEPLPLSNDDLPRLSAEEQEVLLADLIDDNAALRSQLDEARARVEELEGAIRDAVKTAGRRWSEWGARAESVEEILDDAIMTDAVEKARETEEGK